MSVAQPQFVPIDGRQSENALRIARGTARLLHAHGFSVVSELPLPSGRLLAHVNVGGDLEAEADLAESRIFPSHIKSPFISEGQHAIRGPIIGFESSALQRHLAKKGS